jgi:hypothetical protein
VLHRTAVFSVAQFWRAFFLISIELTPCFSPRTLHGADFLADPITHTISSMIYSDNHGLR